MEVTIQIVQARVGDTQKYKLRCKVQATDLGKPKETHEGSVAVALSTDRPQFSFTFATKPSQITLNFLATSSRQESTSYLEKALGSCEGTFSTTLSRHTKTLLIRRQIPETNVEKFTGKLTYTVNLREAAGTDYASLLAEEAKRSRDDVLPSDTPFVSVVFHCATTTLATHQLVGIARIGDRSDIRVDTILRIQESGRQSSQQLSHVPFLKPVRLSCREFDCLELHIVDQTSGLILFSASLVINRLVPFRPIHYNYDSQSSPNRTYTDGQSDSRRPSVSISVLYIPSLSEFSQFEGLEVVVCDITLLSGVMRCRDVVMGLQLVQRNSKMKTPALYNHSLQPPFQAQTKKGPSQKSPDYHVAVLNYHGKEIHSTSSVKAYLLLPYSSSQNKSVGAVLVFHVYGSSGTTLWWNTDSCTSAQMEINEQMITALQAGEVINWKISSKESSELCHVSGIIRWKTKKMPFFTQRSIRKALATPAPPPVALTQIPMNNVRTETVCDDGHQTQNKELTAEQFDPGSLQHILEGLLTPTEGEDLGEGAVEHNNILSQLTEFESNLCHMASDFRILRRENQRLQGDNEQLLLQMAKLKSAVTVSPQTKSTLQQLSTSDLILRICSLQKSLETEERAHERCQDKCQALQNDLGGMEALERRYFELQDAHTAQQKLVEFLRGKVAKYYKCSDVCRKQENIITQLELLLVKQAEGHPSAKDDALSLLSKENTELRALLRQYQSSRDHRQPHEASLFEKEQTIHSLKSQLSQLITRYQHLEQGRDCERPTFGERKAFDTRMFQLEQKLLVAEAKLSAQTSQLQDNAERWMAEKTNYEIQLAELQSRLETVIRSGQKAMSDTPVAPAASTAAEQSVNEQQSREDDHVQRYFSGKTNTKDFSF